MDRKHYVAARIKQAREEKGLSLEQLGELYGCTGAHIWQLEHCVRGVGVHTLDRLANILDKSAEWFLADVADVTESPPPPPMPMSKILRDAQARYDALQTAEIPLRGTLPASSLGDAIEDYIYVLKSDLGTGSRKGMFALKVIGDSLKGADIHSGDFVVVDPDPVEINGKLCVVQLDDSIVGRSLQTNGDKIKLTSLNGTQETTEEETPHILGRIILSGRWRRH